MLYIVQKTHCIMRKFWHFVDWSIDSPMKVFIIAVILGTIIIASIYKICEAEFQKEFGPTTVTEQKTLHFWRGSFLLTYRYEEDECSDGEPARAKRPRPASFFHRHNDHVIEAARSSLPASFLGHSQP